MNTMSLMAVAFLVSFSTLSGGVNTALTQPTATIAFTSGSHCAASVHPLSNSESTNHWTTPLTKNVGQWDDRVLFRASTMGVTIWFTKDGITYQFLRGIEYSGAAQPALGGVDCNLYLQEGRPDADSIEQLLVSAKFVDANPNPQIVAEGLTDTECNYFLGTDHARWRTRVPSYADVILKNIYPGIDIKFSSTEGGIAYQCILAPDADSSQLRVGYALGAQVIPPYSFRVPRTAEWGVALEAIVPSAQHNVPLISRESAPNLAVESRISDSQTGESAPLNAVNLTFSTLLGGDQWDAGQAVICDKDGNTYVTGKTYSSDFPIQDPYQPDQGGYDVFIAKINDGEPTLLYSSYIGGSDYEDGQGIALDASGSIFLTGLTRSIDFPVMNPYQTDQPNDDAFVLKLANTGDSLIYSTYLGGGAADEGRAICVDAVGNAYVAGLTESFGFPTLNPYQSDQGGADVFVAKMSLAGNELVYSTYLGGSSDEGGNGIATDGSGSAYIVGSTTSPDFPTANPFLTYQGPQYKADAFVTKLNPTGSNVVYSTYLGGDGDDYGRGIAVDDTGSVYVTGQTFSSDFPTARPCQEYPGVVPFTSDAFVTRLNAVGNDLVFSTYLGGTGGEWCYAIALDSTGDAYVTGTTSSSDFPVLSPFQNELQGGLYDAFVSRLNRAGGFLVFSTFLGGSEYDEGFGVALDYAGDVHLTGDTKSPDFPAVHAMYPHQGFYDAFVSVLEAFSPCTSCGDANDDGTVDISDAVFLISHIFAGGAAPGFCNYAKGLGDANGDLAVDISDAVYLVSRIFSGGSAPHCYGM